MGGPDRGRCGFGRVRVATGVLVAFLAFGACSPGTPTSTNSGAEAAVTSAAPTESPSASAIGGPNRPDDAEGPYPVVDVVDGDTLKVDIAGETTTVRVIGIDTPETRDPRKPVQCFGREASARAEALLTDQQVWLSADPTQDRVDRYDRLLAHVWLPDDRSFEWVMIADGFAHEYTYDLPYRYQGDYQDAERQARDTGRGLWAPDTCSGDTTVAAE